MERQIRSHALLLTLGVWIGGSAVIWGVVTYNFAGLDHLLSRNQPLAERAGFDPLDPEARKTSVLWVHASELNRVYFEVWSLTQLVLGTLAAGLAIGSRRRLTAGLVLLAVVLVVILVFVIAPGIVELGRQLDFRPRSPPPPELEEFQRLHGLYFGLDLARMLAVCVAAAVAFRRPRG